MGDGGGSVAPSLLFYLFAHRAGVEGRRKRTGTATGIVPCHDDYPVQTWKLATLLLASAFWGLRESGLVDLTVERRTVMYISRHTYLTVTLLGDGDAAGLEGQLLATMHTNPHEGTLNARMREKTQERLEAAGKHEAAERIQDAVERRQRRHEGHLYVERVVPHWFGGPATHRNSPLHVIEVMREIAVSGGYIARDERLSTGMLGRPKATVSFRPDCARINALQPRFEEVLGRWNDFRTREARLCEELWKQCQGGIRDAMIPQRGA